MDIPHNRPTFDRKEIRIARNVIKSRWVAQGEKVTEFENQFCRYLGLPDGHAVAVSSGSAALYLALWALDLKDKRVGVPVYTCRAVSNAVDLIGARSVFLDVDSDGPNVDLNLAASADLDALIAISTFGIPSPITQTFPSAVIEDFSQALGAELDGKKVGTLGKVGIVSLSATKMITSGGQGGILVSHDASLISQVRDYREFDAREDSKNRFNFQMTDLQAAIGSVQLKKLPDFLTRRSEIFDLYSSFGFDLFRENDSAQSAVRYRAVIKVKEPLNLQKGFSSQGIRTIVPFTYGELLSKTDQVPNAIGLANSTLSLPIYPSLGLRNAKKIASILRQALGIS